jgi:prophage antirepressor-like protein
MASGDDRPVDLFTLSDGALAHLLARAEVTRDRLEPLRRKSDDAGEPWVEARDLCRAIERELFRRVEVDLEAAHS